MSRTGLRTGAPHPFLQLLDIPQRFPETFLKRLLPLLSSFESAAHLIAGDAKPVDLLPESEDDLPPLRKGRSGYHVAGGDFCEAGLREKLSLFGRTEPETGGPST